MEEPDTVMAVVVGTEIGTIIAWGPMAGEAEAAGWC